MNAEPRKEHEWLSRLVGEWTYEVEAPSGPGEEAVRLQGSERVRTLGGLWVVCEGEGEMPGGGKATTMMTLGYDPARSCFLGTFVASMMTHLWVYERGALDADGGALTLHCEGPSFGADCTPDGGMAKYQDVIELRGGDVRRVRSFLIGDDGSRQEFMTAEYRRKA